MAARAVSGSSIVWVAVAAAVGAYAAWLSMQLDESRAQAQAATLREQQLVQSLQQVASQTEGRRAAPAAATEQMAVALLRRPELIPFEPHGGGRFYFLEDSVVVLSDRYVYAACEDGHTMCHMLLAYERDGDAIEFTMVDGYQQ